MNISSQAVLVAAAVVLAISSVFAQPPQGQAPQGQAQRGGGAQGMARDGAAQPQGTGVLSGRLLTADTGRPVKRARIAVTGNAAGGGRGGASTTTDEQGRYSLGGLAAGSYNVAASKGGFVDAIYGQRRPMQPGTPVQLGDGQAIANVDLRLTRGGVITGRVVDEDGEALARGLVTVQRYQYVRGERQLTPAGGDQTDDRGQYRVFGLPPGDYYVSAATTGLGEMLGRGLQQLAAGMGALGGGRGGRGIGPGAFAGCGAPGEPEPTGYAPPYFPGVVSAPEAGRIQVGPGQEVSGIDFQIQLVPLITVTGIVTGAEDNVAVMLMPQESAGGAMARLGGQV